MKRLGNLYPQVVSWANLLRACYLAARGKRSRPDVAEFLYDYEFRLLRMQRQLTERTYRPGAYTSFYVYEPKKRQISKAPFPDRIVHHALCNVLEPVFERRFLPDSYACRKGRGTHAAVDRCQHFARRYKYVLKADIRKCFPSIDHQVLKDLMPVSHWFPGDDLFTAHAEHADTFQLRGRLLGNFAFCQPEHAADEPPDGISWYETGSEPDMPLFPMALSHDVERPERGQE